MYDREITETIIGCAIEVHRELGLKLTGIKTGLLLNFNAAVLKDGIRRMVL